MKGFHCERLRIQMQIRGLLYKRCSTSLRWMAILRSKFRWEKQQRMTCNNELLTVIENIHHWKGQKNVKEIAQTFHCSLSKFCQNHTNTKQYTRLNTGYCWMDAVMFYDIFISWVQFPYPYISECVNDETNQVWTWITMTFDLFVKNGQRAQTVSSWKCHSPVPVVSSAAALRSCPWCWSLAQGSAATRV